MDNPRKFSPRNAIFFTNLRKFSPTIVSGSTVHNTYTHSVFPYISTSCMSCSCLNKQTVVCVVVCMLLYCRNADKAGRPQFREIVDTLSQSEEQLLHIPEEVTRGHPQASILGAPLEAGRDLYTELQNTYIS